MSQHTAYTPGPWRAVMYFGFPIIVAQNRRRITVQTLGETITGTVGVTAGWKSAFLLMRSNRALGSEYTLGPNDQIVS